MLSWPLFFSCFLAKFFYTKAQYKLSFKHKGQYFQYSHKPKKRFLGKLDIKLKCQMDNFIYGCIFVMQSLLSIFMYLLCFVFQINKDINSYPKRFFSWPKRIFFPKQEKHPTLKGEKSMRKSNPYIVETSVGTDYSITTCSQKALSITINKPYWLPHYNTTSEAFC